MNMTTKWAAILLSSAVSIGAMANVSVTTDLNLGAAGTNLNGTVILTSQSYLGATFDIVYTLGSISVSNNPFCYVDGATMGVGSDGDIPAHFNTLEGDDGEGMSFTGLAISNFIANGSGLTEDDITNLTFTALTFGSVANNQDGVDISFTDFGVDAANQLLSSGGTGGVTPYTLDLTGLTNYTGTQTGVYFKTDNPASANRWQITGCEVDYTVITGTNAVTTTRADWMRGAWGLSWAPEDMENGRGETLVDDYEAFLDQISGLKTLDYIQLNLGMSYIYSPVHLGPSELLESFWQGDTDGEGNPINLIVPRASSGVDPLGEWAMATKAAGLKVQVYVNSSQMLERGEDTPNPDVIPDITARWKTWCDTNTAAQAFIASQSYHTDGVNSNRPYMFCYAEFVLKDYSLRYGDLIDSYIFDSGGFMSSNGDNATNGVAADQRIYQAFADAARSGNTNATVAFNNGPERDTEELNPFSEAVHAEDYMFGHPYNGGNNLGSHEIGDPPLYDRNYAHIQKMTETGGNVHEGETTHDWTWDDRVVGHFYPPMSTTAWNAGGTPALTDEEFLLWNLEAMQAGGAISWGAPLNWPNGSGASLLINDWGIAQLILMDAHLSTNEVPGAPQWVRQHTPMPDAAIGQAYYRVLTEGVDFWDPEGDTITNVSFTSVADGVPSWLTVEEEPGNPGSWRLVGIPVEAAATNYTFRLRVEDASGGTDRWVELTVNPAPPFLDGPAGYPVWAADPLVIPDATVYEAYTNTLVQGLDFQDLEETNLVVSIVGGADWFSLIETAPGWWQLTGVPAPTDAGVNTVVLSVSDGTHATACTLVLTVEPAVANASILASANTDYGTDAVATMLSDVQTAYDGLATFRFSIDVVPGVGTAIRSGDGGGVTTSQSWGIFSSGEAGNARYIFNGNAVEFVESIGNIQIVNFNDGGGSLSVGDIRDVSFASITIADAQSGGKDSLYFTVGSVSNDLGDLGSNAQSINLETLSDVVSPVTQFSLGTSSTNTLNKWSVNSIEVKYSILGPESYSTWAYDHGLDGVHGAPGSDASDLDGYANLAEFALGMDPTQPDAGSKDWNKMESEGGTNYFDYVHNRRSDYVQQGLSYLLIDTTNLVESVANTNAQDQVFVGPSVDGYESVTNRYVTGDPAQFIQLKIQQD